MPQTFSDDFPDSADYLGDEVCYTDRVVPRGFTKSERQFRHLFSDVFHHHATPECLGQDTELTPAPDGVMRVLQRDDISARFRDAYISEFVVSATANEMPEDLEENGLDSLDDFIELVSAPPVRPGQARHGSNHLSFVTGDVGRGKSLLLVKLLDTLRKRNTSKPAGALRCLPVYIDLEAAWGHQDGKFKDIDGSFYAMIFSRVRAAAAQQKHLQLAQFTADHGAALGANDPAVNLKSICRWLPSQGYYALIIIDNTDRFHFAHTRYSFFEQYKVEQLDSIEKNFLTLFREFQDENSLGALSATIILVCRKSVFSHINQCHDGSELRKPPRDYPVFQVVGALAEDVVRRRVALLGRVIEDVRQRLPPADMERYDKARGILERAMRAAEGGGESGEPPLRTLQYLSDMSHQGLRSFLEFIARLELDSRDDCEVIERVLESRPRNLLRLYVTNMHKRYRQAQKHFPNLFLNDNKINPDDNYPQAHHPPQKQTYWLKYLALKIIQAQPGQSIEFKALRRLLCDVCGYEDALVRLMVGSLGSPHNFKCIDIFYEGDRISQRKLHISSRGSLLVGDDEAGCSLKKEPFCFSFDYLQLVIDDPWLRYPKPWARQIALPNVHIGYTLKRGEQYRTESLAYLKTKAPAALLFLRVLKASWEFERRRIAQLPAAMLERVNPNFDRIEARFMGSIRRVMNSYEEGNSIYQALEQDWRRMSNDASFENWWADFRGVDPEVC